MKLRNVLLGVILISSIGFADDAVQAPPVAPHTGWKFSETGMIPVQSGGRLKPFDSYAREVVLYLTGSRSFQGWDLNKSAKRPTFLNCFKYAEIKTKEPWLSRRIVI